VERRAELGAVEPSVASRRRDGRPEPPFAYGAIESRLADAQELRRLARSNETRAVRLVERCLGECPDGALAEPAMAAGSDERRVQQTPRHSARNSRPAHAEAGCHIARTDQSVQGVVLRLTNPYQKAVAFLHTSELPAWNLTSGAVVSSLKMCIDRRARPEDPCQNFHCANRAMGLQKGQESSLVRTSPPAAKLGAGVEKSPGPSLFQGVFAQSATASFQWRSG